MRSLVRVCLCARGAGAGWAQGQRLGMGYREGWEHWEELAVDRQMRLGFGLGMGGERAVKRAGEGVNG